MKLPPIKAIRAMCIDCCAGLPKEVRLCSIEKCPLYPYRMGHRPKDSDLPTEETNGEKTRGYVAIFD